MRLLTITVDLDRVAEGFQISTRTAFDDGKFRGEGEFCNYKIIAREEAASMPAEPMGAVKADPESPVRYPKRYSKVFKDAACNYIEYTVTVQEEVLRSTVAEAIDETLHNLNMRRSLKHKLKEVGLYAASRTDCQRK